MEFAFEEQWEFVLNHPNSHVRTIAQRASREPVFRRRFPYASLNNLRFSTKTEYPYDLLPYVRRVTELGRYEARAGDNEPLAAGDLETIIGVVAAAMSKELETPSRLSLPE
jgi:hypothetical protein